MADVDEILEEILKRLKAIEDEVYGTKDQSEPSEPAPDVEHQKAMMRKAYLQKHGNSLKSANEFEELYKEYMVVQEILDKPIDDLTQGDLLTLQLHGLLSSSSTPRTRELRKVIQPQLKEKSYKDLFKAAHPSFSVPTKEVSNQWKKIQKWQKFEEE